MRPTVLPMRTISTRQTSLYPLTRQYQPSLGQKSFFSSGNSTPSKPAPEKSQSHEIPKANFKDLGANRTVKIVVITCLSIVATMESVFWMKLIWARYGPSPEKEGSEAGKEA